MRNLLRVLLWLAGAGCSVSLEVPEQARIRCAADADCPERRVCVTDLGTCEAPDSSCIERTANGFVAVALATPCILPGEVETRGVCVHGACLESRCGDGVLDTQVRYEACDDGPENSDDAPDACRSTCVLPSCGDGVVDFTRGEQCDDGAANGEGSACSVECTTGCGDGHLQPGEACDDGNAGSGDGCDTNCTPTACGNGVHTVGEECDDGNPADGDGCDHNCTVTRCGNGVTTEGEECDDGNLTSGDGCDSNCRETGCGNGVPTEDEECDDGDFADGDGCDHNCTVTRCGNGVPTAGELCDDGNVTGGDNCSADCHSLEICGNAITDAPMGESCDCGDDEHGLPLPPGCNGYNSDELGATCRPSCQYPFCGDGVIDGTEQCEGDDLAGLTCLQVGYYGGELACGATCRYDVSGCVPYGYCGDGVRNGPELCDGEAAGTSCVSLGFDRGALSCSAVCTPLMGQCGTIGWRSTNQGTAMLRAVWGSGPNDVFVGGFDGVLHYDGSTWRFMTEWPVHSLWGFSPTDVVAAFGIVRRYNGSEWSDWPVSAPVPVSELWGTSDNDLYALGTECSSVYHWDGVAWTEVYTRAGGSLQGVSGSSSNDVWVVGWNGSLSDPRSLVVHFDGESWSEELLGACENGCLTEVAALGDNKAWVAGGTVFYFDGALWHDLAIPGAGPINDLSAVDGQILAVGSGKIFRHDGVAWRELETDTSAQLNGIWGSSPWNVFAVGENGTIVRYQGYDWVSVTNFSAIVVGLWIFAENDIWASTTGGVSHFDGTSWSAMVPVAIGIDKLWGNDAGELWAVAYRGAWHYDGDAWAAVLEVPDFHSTDISGTSTGEVFVSGFDESADHLGEARVYAYLDGAWGQLLPDPPGTYPQAMVALGRNDVYLAELFSLLHFDGSTWEQVSDDYVFDAIAVNGADDIYTVGSGGVVAHYEESTWLDVPTHTRANLNAIWSPGGSVAFAVGDNGTLLERLADGFHPLRIPTTEQLVLVQGSISHRRVVVGGAGGFVGVLEIPPAP